MALTYVNIATQTLGSSQTSVTFSSIPSTYTDLVLRYSFRDDYSGYTPFFLRVNGLTTTIYSTTYLSGDGSAASSARISNNNITELYWNQNTLSTANTFSNGEIYIPSYLASANKPFSTFSVSENNQSFNRGALGASLIRTTAAISSIAISSGTTGYNFVSGSTFYLYGIKNS